MRASPEVVEGEEVGGHLLRPRRISRTQPNNWSWRRSTSSSRENLKPSLAEDSPAGSCRAEQQGVTGADATPSRQNGPGVLVLSESNVLQQTLGTTPHGIGSVQTTSPLPSTKPLTGPDVSNMRSPPSSARLVLRSSSGAGSALHNSFSLTEEGVAALGSPHAALQTTACARDGGADQPEHSVQESAASASLRHELEQAKAEIERLDKELQASHQAYRKAAADLEHREQQLAEQAQQQSLLQQRQQLAERMAAALADLTTTLQPQGAMEEASGSGVAGASAAEEQDVLSVTQQCIQQVRALQERYLAATARCRELHNALLDMKGAIRVFCRLRPLLPQEQCCGEAAAAKADPAAASLRVTTGRMGGINKGGGMSDQQRSLSFSFDAVFGPNAGQADVFEEVQSLSTSVLDGYNVCIFAYGQTGSGKTHTIEGNPSEPGINFLTLEELFCLADQRQQDCHYKISISMCEVYLEQIRDLLSDGSEEQRDTTKLEVKQGAHGSYIAGLTDHEVGSVEEAWLLLSRGSAQRSAAHTAMNQDSSRSHCLTLVKVHGRRKLDGTGWRGRLWLVDLAGSERLARSEASGQRLREAQFINRSLACLGDCINALATHARHVPFRNSKLTHILQDSLTGNSKALMIVHAAPSEKDAAETACSLTFASRVRGIELGAAQRQVEPPTAEGGAAGGANALQLTALEEEVQALKEAQQGVEAGLVVRDQQVTALQQRLAAANLQLEREQRERTQLEERCQQLQRAAVGSTAAAAASTQQPASPRLLAGMMTPLAAPPVTPYGAIRATRPPGSAVPTSAFKSGRAEGGGTSFLQRTMRRTTSLARSTFTFVRSPTRAAPAPPMPPPAPRLGSTSMQQAPIAATTSTAGRPVAAASAAPSSQAVAAGLRSALRPERPEGLGKARSVTFNVTAAAVGADPPAAPPAKPAAGRAEVPPLQLQTLAGQADSSKRLVAAKKASKAADYLKKFEEYRHSAEEARLRKSAQPGRTATKAAAASLRNPPARVKASGKPTGLPLQEATGNASARSSRWL